MRRALRTNSFMAQWMAILANGRPSWAYCPCISISSTCSPCCSSCLASARTDPTNDWNSDSLIRRLADAHDLGAQIQGVNLGPERGAAHPKLNRRSRLLGGVANYSTAYLGFRRGDAPLPPSRPSHSDQYTHHC